jgi:hypothetical protein
MSSSAADKTSPGLFMEILGGVLIGFFERSRGVGVEARGGPPFPQVVERPEVMGFQFGEGQPESREAAEKASTQSLTRR